MVLIRVLAFSLFFEKNKTRGGESISRNIDYLVVIITQGYISGIHTTKGVDTTQQHYHHIIPHTTQRGTLNYHI